MDDFSIDRPELTGTLITLEFGAGGRITQLWATDPNLPEEGEEFQFVLPPVNFGEEFAEDYYPGTILVGARTAPEEPWVVARTSGAEQLEELDDPLSISFEYELGLLPELSCTGRFYEQPGPLPQILWDLTLRNRGRKSIEIGELAFPFALNNLYEGFGRQKPGGKSIWLDRLHIHKFIGGAASYLFAQRLNAESPSLLICPGDETEWEFFAHAPASLSTPFRWAGVPIVYVLSKASVEREGWGTWANDHTSLILEPGDQRTFQTRFIPSERDRLDFVYQTLAACGRPAMKLLPGAVSPTDVGIAVEIAGATPTRFFATGEAELETDADEEGGFCFVKPKKSGPLRLSFEDTKGRTSHAHLLFIDPIDQLIKARADWTVKNQLQEDPESALHHAFLVADTVTGHKLSAEEELGGGFAVEGGLSDALFLAEKNAIYPDRAQIRQLDDYIQDFVRDDLQNPGDDTVGSAFTDSRSVALNYGRPEMYPMTYSLYHSMYRVASTYGETRLEAREYLSLAYRTAIAMFREGIQRSARSAGLLGNGRLFDLMEDLAAVGMTDEVGQLLKFTNARASEILRREFPYAPEGTWDTAGFEEVHALARYMQDDESQERAIRCAFAARSLAPSWWWYGGDMRQFDSAELLAHMGNGDSGELCLGYTTAANSLMFFQNLDHDYGQIPEAHMRLAFGGLLSPWALVEPDGSAAMGYCPDQASKHFGKNALTGDIGVSLFHYLRGAGAYVLPSRTYGVFTFGCHFEVEDRYYVVRPWDGVGRRVVLRQIGAEFWVRFGKIEEVRLDARKRWAEVVLTNPADKSIAVALFAKGLWGRKFEVSGRPTESVDGILGVSITVAAHATTRVQMKVVE